MGGGVKGGQVSKDVFDGRGCDSCRGRWVCGGWGMSQGGHNEGSGSGVFWGMHLEWGFGLGCRRWVFDARVVGVVDVVQEGKVEVDWPQVFPCSAVPFAFGLSKVTAWCGSLADDGPGDVLIIYWGPEEHFWAWYELRKCARSMGLVELCAL